MAYKKLVTKTQTKQKSKLIFLYIQTIKKY